MKRTPESVLNSAIERWDAISRLTDPVDHARAERALHRVYRANRWEPASVRWVSSPLELAALSLERGVQAFHEHPEQVFSSSPDLISSLIDDLDPHILPSTMVWLMIESDVIDALSTQGVSAEAMIEAFGVTHERDGTPEPRSDRIASWFSACAFYAAHVELGSSLDPAIRPLLDLSAACSPFALGREEALLSERPQRLRIGEHVLPDWFEVLHSEEGPAYLFADGFQGTYVHGVAPEDLALYRENTG